MTPQLQTVLVQKPTLQQQLIAIDADLPNLEILLADLGSYCTVLKIERQQDVIDVITEALAQSQARSLAIVAHGAPGKVAIGRDGIDSTSLRNRAAKIQTWGVETIELYSCHTGSDAAFMRLFYALSRADIFASREVVGHNVQGGSWVLENAFGVLALPPFAPAARQNWEGTLDF